MMITPLQDWAPLAEPVYSSGIVAKKSPWCQEGRQFVDSGPNPGTAILCYFELCVCVFANIFGECVQHICACGQYMILHV